MCNICSSEFLGEINKKRNWRPDRVIGWANRRGLNISESDLKTHFDEHAPPVEKKNKRRKSSSREPAKENKSSGGILSAGIDTQFLDEVVRRVYSDLAAGEFQLKLEHGFKAIEIKQKIEDKTDVENLLLELLNEIRQQELA